MGSKIFTIFIGDLVESRGMKGRQRFARKLNRQIARISQDFSEEFYAPITLTKGIDELTGVLKRPNMCYQICRYVNQLLYPYQFRFAVVRGHIDIAVRSKDARKMDGPAFHRAANIIEDSKKENIYYCFSIEPKSPCIDYLLNEVANLLHILREQWSEHQRKIAHLYEQTGNQKKVAKKLGITQQAVSDALRQAHWKEIKRAEKTIDKTLNK